MKRKSLLILAAIILVLPVIASAAGLVPCGGAGEPACQGCHFVALLEKIVDWLVAVLSIVFSIIVVVAGLRLVTSTGDASAKTAAKKMIMNAFIGFVIVLAGWLIVDFVMKSLLTPGAANAVPWSTIQCVKL